MITAKTKEKSKEKEGFSVRKKIALFFLGGIVGLLNGLFGGGGGVVGVPILEKVLGLDSKHSHATCLAVILPLSIVSSAFYVLFGEVNSIAFLQVGLGVVIGGVVGAFVLKFLPEKIIRTIFAVLLLAGGIRLILW